MFKSKKKIKELEDKTEGLESKIEGLREQVQSAKDELADTKHKKKMEDEDIKHMVKMSKEKCDIEFQKKVMEIEKDQQSAIATVKDEYRDKLEARLQTEVDNIKEMYGHILERLPNVNARLKGDL